MSSFLASAAVGTLALLTVSVSAAAQERSLDIELNRVLQAQNGCRMSFIAVNKLGTALDKTALEIVVFDENSVISQTLVLDFGRLRSGQTKVVEFDLPNECGKISRVLINGISECAGGSAGDMAEACFDALRTSNKAQINFGVTH